MIDFRVLGPIELGGPEGEEILSVLSQPKRVALLAYLALAVDRGFRRRDTTIGLFWPELDQDRARGALRKSLHFLRRSLGEEALVGRGDEEIALSWKVLTCDAVEFEAALAGGELEQALEFYRGDLLEGVFLTGCPEFERWLDGERERLRELAAVAAWEMAQRLVTEGRVTEGERMGQRALTLVPTDENEVQSFIRALNHAGDRAAAIRFYEKFAQELKDLLELRPAAETRALAQEIRNTMGTPIPKAVPPVPPESPAPPGLKVRDESADQEKEPVDLFKKIRGALAQRYTLEEEIGQGGMATVFLAEDQKHRRKVAIKVLDPSLAEALGSERFLNEIQIAANLTHPHILPLFDSGKADGLLYYVMPFVEGESLRSRLEREKQLPVDDAVSIAREIASALDFAHERGVIHRDVKPANILLEAGHAVLADFGIAHAVALAGENRQTRSGVSLGTPAYMSPEQGTGEKEPDGRSDQYGLGCVLYEMLAGDQPFRGSTGESVARQHLTHNPPPISQLRPSVPAGIASALHRAMAKVPADRFPTMKGYSDALREGMRPPGQPPPRTGTFFRTRRSRIVAGLGLAGLAAMALLLSIPREDPRPAPVPTPPGHSLVAVMPFSVNGPEDLIYLRDGLAVLLGIRLDDVDGVRTVDRNTFLPFVADLGRGGRVSLDEAREAARRFGATHLILGEGFGAGGEDLTLAAALYPVDADPQEALEESVTGSSKDLYALLDGLAGPLLAGLHVTSGERLSGIAALTTDSLSALKDYLRGEEEFRATRYDDALEFFDAAVGVDPTFALAHYRRSVVAVLSMKFDEAHNAANRAWDHSARLTGRDRRLLEAWVAMIEGAADKAERLYRAILLDSPDEVEAHFGLGSVQVYFNPIRGLSSAEAESHFQSVLDLSPGFGQARFHLLEFAASRRDKDAFDSLFAEVDPRSDQALAWAAVGAFGWGGDEERRQIERRMRLADPKAAGLAVARVAAFLHDYGAAEQLASLLSGPDRDDDTRCAAHLLIAMTQFARGRWAEGMAYLQAAGSFNGSWAIELSSLYTGFPFRPTDPEEVIAIQETLLAWDADQEGLSTNFVLFAHNGFHPSLRLYLLALTNIWAGNLDDARQYSAELRNRPHSPERREVTGAWSQAIRARANAADGGDTAQVVRALEAAGFDAPLEQIAISPFFSRTFDRFLLGDLLKSLGRNEEALAWFGSLTEGHELVMVGPAHFRMGEISEELGDRSAALDHYSRFIELWSQADSVFNPLLEKAMEKISLFTDSI